MISQREEIESGVVGLLARLQVAGHPGFAAVEVAVGADLPALLAQASRRPAPLALVDLTERSNPNPRRTPRTRWLTVVVATRDNLPPGSCGAGEAPVPAAWAAARLATSVLDGVVLAGRHRVAALAEELLAADAQQALLALRHLVQSAEPRPAPTLDGRPVAGEAAEIAVHIAGRGDARCAPEQGERAVIWSGVLRAATHAELNAVEERLESVVGDGARRLLTDEAGHEIPNCVATCFARCGPRRLHPVLGTVLQPFKLAFRQLAA